MLILIRCRVDVLCCPTVIMDMSGAATGTAGPPSGSIPPLCPEAAARVKTTLTVQGEDCTIYQEFILISYHVYTLMCFFFAQMCVL